MLVPNLQYQLNHAAAASMDIILILDELKYYLIQSNSYPAKLESDLIKTKVRLLNQGKEEIEQKDVL